jgi:hypothetical protein
MMEAVLISVIPKQEATEIKTGRLRQSKVCERIERRNKLTVEKKNY